MFVNQKAQEISYALVRIVPYIRRPEFRKRIERLAMQFLEDVAAENFEQALKAVASLIALINLGKAVYEIEPVNAKVLIGELNLINSAIRKVVGLEDVPDDLPNLQNFFSKVPVVVEEKHEDSEIENDNLTSNGGNGNGIAGTIRQSAILERIRQSDNRKVQLRDLINSFPEVSERTMRYDLQKLCFQGLLERVGNGGPGSYYAIK